MIVIIKHCCYNIEKRKGLKSFLFLFDKIVLHNENKILQKNKIKINKIKNKKHAKNILELKTLIIDNYSRIIKKIILILK